MFEKSKARIAKLEEDHDNLRAIHQHVANNKTIYTAVGASAATMIVLKITGHASAPDMQQVINTDPSNRGLLYKSTQVINNTIHQTMVRQGEPGKKTFWVEKGVWFPSRKSAAIAAGVSMTSVSKCCDGVVDSVKGQHFVGGGDMV